MLPDGRLVHLLLPGREMRFLGVTRKGVEGILLYQNKVEFN